MSQTIETYTTALRSARAQGLTYRVKQSYNEICSQYDDSLPKTIHTSFPLISYPNYDVSAHTDIGSRASQEDRFTVCFEVVKGRSDTGFFAVFDGTVGDFASDTVKDMVLPHLINSLPWPRVVELFQNRNDTIEKTKSSESDQEDTAQNKENLEKLSQQYKQNHTDVVTGTTTESLNKNNNNELLQLIYQAMDWMFLNVDAELLHLCNIHKKDYASSTAVTVLLLGEFGCVGHLGDSRVVLGYEKNGLLFAHFLTEDHKPNKPYEQERILRCGGSVEYLHNHNNKPFLRGGDFTFRKSRGDQPMQLQYSRAFGGKDLKVFGLSSEPDLKLFKIQPTYRVLILASDGIWDVQTAERSVEIVMAAKKKGEDPASSLIQSTLAQQRSKNSNADNLTVIVIFFNEAKYSATAESQEMKQVIH